MPLLTAVKKTFSAEGMCGICHTVADAKRNDSSDASTPDAAGKSLDKIFLVFAPADPPLTMAPVVFSWSLSDRSIPTADRAAPPLPPPRPLA
jgi:hypothetical protein